MASPRLSQFEESILRKVGVQLPDGRIVRQGRRGNAIITSAEDAKRAAATRARDALLDAQTRASSSADDMLATERARMGLPPVASLAPAPGAVAAAPGNNLAAFDPSEDFKATQRLRDAQSRGLLPNRDYSDEALARATPQQRIAEASLLDQRVRQAAFDLAGGRADPGAAPALSQVVMPAQAQALPGGVPQPAGTGFVVGPDGTRFGVGRDGTIARFAADDNEGLARWAADQASLAAEEPVAADTTTDFAAQRQAVFDRAARSIAMVGNDPNAVAGINAIADAELKALDPDGSRTWALEQSRRAAELDDAAERQRIMLDEAARREFNLRTELAVAAEQRAEELRQKDLPFMAAAFARTRQDEAALDQVMQESVQRQLAQVGRPLLQAATAAASTLASSGPGRVPGTPQFQAAQQLMAAAQAGRPDQVAGLVSTLVGLYPDALGSANELVDAYAKESFAIRGNAERNKENTRNRLREEAARIAAASGFRVYDPALAGQPTASAAPPVDPATGEVQAASDDPLAVVEAPPAASVPPPVTDGATRISDLAGEPDGRTGAAVPGPNLVGGPDGRAVAAVPVVRIPGPNLVTGEGLSELSDAELDAALRRFLFSQSVTFGDPRNATAQRDAAFANIAREKQRRAELAAYRAEGARRLEELAAGGPTPVAARVVRRLMGDFSQ